MNFSVVFEDLLSASNVFHDEAYSYAHLKPVFIEPPSVVDYTLDWSIQAILQSISLTQEMLSESIDGHSTKLKLVHDNYKNAENLTSEQLFNILKNPDTLG